MNPSDPSPAQELHLHVLDYLQVLKNRLGMILLTLVLVLLVVGVITYLQDQLFQGHVRGEIRKDENRSGVQSGVDHLVLDMRYLETQFRIIESDQALRRVANNQTLKLVEVWDDVTNLDEAVAKLKRNLTVSNDRRSYMVEIKYLDTDPERAAAIANAIGEAYEEARREFEGDKGLTGLEEIRKQIRQQEQEVNGLGVALQDKARELGIIDTGALTGDDRPSGRGFSGPVTSAGYRAFETLQAYEVHKDETDRMRVEIQQLAGKEDDELISLALGLNLPDQRFAAYQSQKIEAERSLDQFRGEGLGRKHPTMVSLEQSIERFEAELLKAAREYRDTLQQRMEALEAQLVVLEEKRDEALQTRERERLRLFSYEEVKGEHDTAQMVLAQLRIEAATMATQTEREKRFFNVTDAAIPNRVAVKPNVTINLALGGMVGLVFGLGLAFFLEYMNTSVKSIADVERYLRVPVLAVIPKDVGLLHKQSGLSPDAEAYRILRTNIEFNRKSALSNAITVVSGGAGEGKSTTLANLAYVCAQGGYNTLIIDGDLRRPKMHTFFDINNAVGLTNYLTTDLALEDVVLKTPVENLYFLPSGILPADATGILNSRRMSELIADVKGRFDLVLIDSPPILGVSDASVLASEVDLTLVVVQHRKLPRNMLMRVKQAVENVGGNLVGVVLNNVDVKSDNQYQYYTSYYTYYSPANTRVRQAESRPPAAIEIPAERAAAPIWAGGGSEDVVTPVVLGRTGQHSVGGGATGTSWSGGAEREQGIGGVDAEGAADVAGARAGGSPGWVDPAGVFGGSPGTGTQLAGGELAGGEVKQDDIGAWWEMGLEEGRTEAAQGRAVAGWSQRVDGEGGALEGGLESPHAAQEGGYRAPSPFTVEGLLDGGSEGRHEGAAPSWPLRGGGDA